MYQIRLLLIPCEKKNRLTNRKINCVVCYIMLVSYDLVKGHFYGFLVLLSYLDKVLVRNLSITLNIAHDSVDLSLSCNSYSFVDDVIVQPIN